MSVQLTLLELGHKYGTDKATHHGYLPYYATVFQPLKMLPLRLIELGVGSGASLAMWRDFFPNAKIIGVDFRLPPLPIVDDRITTLLGDATAEPLVGTLKEKFLDFQIVIDDASHRMDDQLKSFKLLFPLLSPGGYYCIEDMHTSFRPEYGGTSDGTGSTCLAAVLASASNLCRVDGNFSGEIDTISFFPGLVVMRKSLAPAREL